MKADSCPVCLCVYLFQYSKPNESNESVTRDNRMCVAYAGLKQMVCKVSSNNSNGMSDRRKRR